MKLGPAAASGGPLLGRLAVYSGLLGRVCAKVIIAKIIEKMIKLSAKNENFRSALRVEMLV